MDDLDIGTRFYTPNGPASVEWIELGGIMIFCVEFDDGGQRLLTLDQLDGLLTCGMWKIRHLSAHERLDEMMEAQ